MSDVATLEAESETTELIILTDTDQLSILTDTERFDAFYDQVAKLVKSHVPDTSTSKGRKAIASLARKVVTTKTTLDAAGKALTEESRKTIARVDESRRNIRLKLDALRDEARAPLNQWEEAEEARQEKVRGAIEALKAAAVITAEDTVDTVEDRLFAVGEVSITADEFQEMEPIARSLVDQAKAALSSASARLKQEAADREELEKLRKERAEREAAEAAAEQARLAAQREAEAEERRKAEAERIAKEATEKAEAEARQKAETERLETQRRHDEEIAAEKRRADEAERIAKEEREAAAKAKAEEERKAKVEADAKARREANEAHRSKVLRTAKEGLMERAGLDEETARKVVLAIVGNVIPNVSITF